ENKTPSHSKLKAVLAASPGFSEEHLGLRRHDAAFASCLVGPGCACIHCRFPPCLSGRKSGDVSPQSKAAPHLGLPPIVWNGECAGRGAAAGGRRPADRELADRLYVL